jgi:hypothetical protein
MYGMILCMAGSSKRGQLRRLVTARRQLDAQIDALTESLLREGEFVEDVAGDLGVSREKVRRFRKDRDIPDAREIRRAKGAPARRHQDGTGGIEGEEAE